MNEFELIPKYTDHLLSTIALLPRKQKVEFFIFVINSYQTFISQIYKAVSL